MILDLGFGHTLKTSQINNEIDRSCRWMDFKPEVVSMAVSVPTIDSSWIQRVAVLSNPVLTPAGGVLYPLASEHFFLVVDHVRSDGLDLVCYIKLWGSLFDFLHENRDYQFDSDFEPLVLVSPSTVFLGCRVSKIVRPPLSIDRFEVSDWSVQSLGCLIQCGDKPFLLKDLSQVQYDIEVLLNIVRFNKKYNKTLFIRADSAMDFIKKLQFQNWFQGFHFDSMLAHEELNHHCHFSIFLSEPQVLGSKRLGYTTADRSLRYRDYSWHLV